MILINLLSLIKMNNLLPEIVNHILYFTRNKVNELSLVCKYFNNNTKRIRIISNEKYPNIKNKDIKKLTNLLILNLCMNDIIINNGIRDLQNLTTLDLSYNNKITDDGISKLTNLVHLKL